MIDFIKGSYVGDLVAEFAQKHGDKMVASVNESSGELFSKWRVVRHGNFKVRVLLNENQLENPGGRMEITGSLHKNYYQGANFQRFDFLMLREEIFFLSNFLGVPPSELKIQQLEFGLNVLLWEPAIMYLKRRLVSMAGHRFLAYLPDKKGKAIGFYAGTTMILKCYDKGLQYDLPYPLLRIEMRCLKSEYLKDLGIEHLSDLEEYENIKKLANRYFNLWNSVLLHDDTALRMHFEETGKANEFLGAHSHDKWEEWRSRMSNSGFHKKKARYRRIIKDFDRKRGQDIYNLLVEELDRCFD